LMGRRWAKSISIPYLLVARESSLSPCGIILDSLGCGRYIIISIPGTKICNPDPPRPTKPAYR